MENNEKQLLEKETRKIIDNALKKAGWDFDTQVVEEYPITKGRIIAKNTVKREKPLQADYVLFYKPNKPIAIVEAKKYQLEEYVGMQQGLKYARMLDVPFVFSANGKGFIFHNKYITQGEVETHLNNDEFPSPEKLWKMYHEHNHIAPAQDRIIDEPYYTDNPNKQPRYYQINAINKTVEAIANGQKRVLLVMATGTGKTYTAFQIIWRLWKSGIKKRILFLADRRSLISQTFVNDFAPFKDKMTWVTKQNFDTAHEIYLALYQGLTSDDEEEVEEKEEEETKTLFSKFSPGFFDLVIVDECHRGSAKADSQWRNILEYFKDATQIGMTATPKEDKYISNIDYFGNPIYTYSLKQGIDDGFLAPYRVIRIDLDSDEYGFTPYEGQRDDNGEIIEQRTYTIKDYDRTIVLKSRTKAVAKIVSDYLKKHNCRMDKAIFFCRNQNHAARMREALINENADLCHQDDRYVMRITSDDETGVKELDNFRSVESKYPVLVTTSKLLSTGVDVPTVKYIILDSFIQSKTEFKQIIGRGTRVREDLEKMYFTIFDFRKATFHFSDPNFDGPVEQCEEFNPDVPITPAPPPKPPETPEPAKHKTKYVVSGGGEVTVVREIVQYMNNNGQLVTVNLIDYTKRNLLKKYSSMQDFLTAWNEAERKKAIVDELEEYGIFFDDLKEATGRDLDPFDMILHVAFDQPPLTRKERAENVRKRNYFAKYGKQAAEILDILLTKYADKGFAPLENIDILGTDPIKEFGTPIQIVKEIFGGKIFFQKAVKDLENAIYYQKDMTTYGNVGTY